MNRSEWAYVGLGSNLGDRQKHLDQAVAAVNQLPLTSVRRCSSWFENEAVGIPDGLPFLNGVAEVITGLPPLPFLGHLQQLEREHGRETTRTKGCWTNRTLDLDILFFGYRCLVSEDLVVPHPRLHEREFVLAPLRDLGVSVGNYEELLIPCV